MKKILERVKAGEILVADGAMGTMLFERGLKPGECPEAFNLTQPEVLREIAQLYLAAGAEILQTNTFGASPLKLASYHLADKTEEINREAILITRSVAAERAYVNVSCGPSGKLLKPYGDTEAATVYASFARQMKAIQDAQADIICVETMSDLAEASLAIKAAKAEAPSIPVMATMTFEATKKGFFTIMGVGIPQAVAGLEKAGADIVGSNCGNGVEQMLVIAQQMRQATRLPLAIRPNAGLPQMVNNQPVYMETPAFMAEKLKRLLDFGVSVIGGCCGTTPAHISALRLAIKPRI
jgi:5-methyltetrahydrofolate--homocysteine methyltransferase